MTSLPADEAERRYQAAMDAMARPRMRVVGWFASVVISIVTLFELVFAEDTSVLWVPTRGLLLGLGVMAVAVAQKKTLPPWVYRWLSVVVITAAVLHIEWMVLFRGDFGGSFPFLVLIAPLSALMLPLTGRMVGGLSATMLLLHGGAALLGVHPGDHRHRVLEWLALATGAAMATWMAAVADRGRRKEAMQQALLDAALQRSDNLLQNILPEPIAEKLKATSHPIADGFAEVTILFADIVGFTAMSDQLSPERLVKELNALFSAFDDEAARRGLEKIKTIGDCYMVAAGLPEPREDHAEAIVSFSLWLQDTVEHWPPVEGNTLSLRIGINTGPVVAGVIGRSKFIYDLWGDAVNVASRMESTGEAGRVQVTEATARVLSPERFHLTQREHVRVKGKGTMTTYFVRKRQHREAV